MTDVAAPGERADRTDPGRSTAIPASGAGILAALALGWLIAMLWSAHAAISADSGALAITSAAYSLPGVVSAMLVCGAALGLVAVALVARRRPALGQADQPGRRFAVALATGLLSGLAAASTVVATYGTGAASMVLGGTVAAAGTIGGAIAGLRARHLVAAAVAAALAVFAVSFLFTNFKHPLLDLYGFGESDASRHSAYGWFAATASLGCGFAAGLVAFAYLRRVARAAARSTEMRWPSYLAAGAGAGLLLLIAELVTRVGGARVLSIAGAVSADDGTVRAWLDGSRINYALVVLFTGAIAALFALGRTLKTPESTDE